MPKLPFLKFFPNDWLAEPTIRVCSLAARGLWVDMLSLMHLSPRRGYLLAATGSPMSPEQLARLTGCSADEVTRLLAELKSSGVFSCTEDGAIYSRRMVREEGKREKCSDAGRKGGGNPTFKGRGKGGPKGGDKGDCKPLEARSQKLETRDTPLPPAEPGGGAGGRNEPPDFATIDTNLWPEFLAAWNAAGLPGAGKVQRTHNRVGWLQQRLAVADWRARWRAAIARAGESARCCGRVGTWRLNLDAFLKTPDMLVRILEGEFDDAPATLPMPARDGTHRAGAPRPQRALTPFESQHMRYSPTTGAERDADGKLILDQLCSDPKCAHCLPRRTGEAA